MTQSPDLLRVVSVSGGKDSTATLLLALETNWLDDVRAIFADTGNEHEITYEYVEYLSDHMERETGRRIETVRSDFTKAMAEKREKLLRIAAGVPESEIYGKRIFSAQWTPERAGKAAELMRPTGNVYLDLCLMKGGFPSRKRQYCTTYLKTEPLDAWTYARVSEGWRIESWHGIRAEEGQRRALLPEQIWGPVLSLRYPILSWTVDRVFAQHHRHAINPNPLYMRGFRRVGCMPCINSAKADIENIAARCPEHIEKVREYERLVSECSRNETPATFIHVKTLSGSRGIDEAVRWAKTTHGGKQYDLLADAEDVTQCSSEYGLCE